MEIFDKLIAEAIELGLEVGEFKIGEFHYNELKKMVESSTNIKVDITKVNYYKGIPVILHSENSIVCTFKLTKSCIKTKITMLTTKQKHTQIKQKAKPVKKNNTINF